MKIFQKDTNNSLTTGLISYYKMEGNSTDFYGSYNGTDTHVTYSNQTGSISKAAVFDGTTGGSGAQINLGSLLGASQTTVSISGIFSIAAWNTSYIGIFQSNSGSQSGIQLFVNNSSSGSGGHLCGRVLSGSVTFDTGLTPSLNTPYFFVVTYNGSTLQVVINGTTYSENHSGTLANGTFLLGYFGGGASNSNLQGWIDEVGIWNRVLTTTEISDLYNGGAGQTMVYGQTFTEAVTNTDTFLKGLYRSFTEAVTNSDTFTGIKIMLKLFTEAVQSTDTLIKAIGKNLSEAVQNTDTLIKGIYRNFTEAVTNSDTFITAKVLLLNLFESVKSTASLWLNGMFIDDWWTKRTRAVIAWTKRTIGSIVYTKRNKPQK
jgi:hypothetical protein